jgi:hypothetical protein
MQKTRLTQQEYLDERRQLSKYQQENYQNYEKTLVTLSGSFIAFSMALLTFLAKDSSPKAAAASVVYSKYVVGSWFAFGSSLLILLGGFFVSIRVFTIEAVLLEEALEDLGALGKSNWWNTISLWLNGLSAFCFLSGVILLMVFCWNVFS